ncbi:MAG: CHASE2 domain-containing protein [Thermodesulfobacteriota bacterium]
MVSLIIFLSGALDLFELKAFDLFSRYLNPTGASEKIAIVQVDQESIEALSKEGITWPWPRQIYAPIVEYLSQAEALFIDILFTEPSSYGVEDDLIFSEAIKKANNVHLPVFLSNKDEPITSKDREVLDHLAIRDEISTALKFNSIVYPIDVLRKSIRGSGNVTISPDDDGVYRRIPLVFQLREYLIPHFLLSHLLDKGMVKIRKNRIYVNDKEIPLVNGKLLLRYYKNNNPFKTFSASEILKSYLDVNSSKTPAIREDFFKGKIVFLGLSAAGLYDLKPTSISPISTGVLIHATTLDNVINKSFIRPVNDVLVVVFILLISFFVSYSVIKRHSLAINLSLFLVTLAIIVLLDALLFKNAIYMKIIPPISSLLVSFMIAVAYSYATEGRQRLFLKNTISQYMDKKIADFLLENPSLIKPGGQEKRVTVFFADIAGFTTMSEKTTPEKIAKLLHTVLNSLTDVIIRNQGVIDKYIGDCVMAFWGAPFESENDELNACYSAIQCIESINLLNEGFRNEGSPDLNIRIGIHTGDAIAGNIGSDRLFHYTVIGDTVNLASRLESANKFFKTRLIISEETIQKTDNTFITRELGSIAVKGKELPIKIFELMDEEKRADPGTKGLAELYHQGMQYHGQQRFKEAIEIFDEILKKYPEDGPSEFYKRRCEYLLSNTDLTEDWNIIKFTEK